MRKLIYVSLAILLVCCLYYVISLLTMSSQGNFVVNHYYNYENIEKAKQDDGLIDEDVLFKLEGFNFEQEKLIKDHIQIYITKSNYQTFYGFWFNIKSQDDEMMRVEIRTKKKIEHLPDFLIGKKLLYKGNSSTLTYRSLHLHRNQKEVKLEIIEYQNHKPIKLGEMIVEFK